MSVADVCKVRMGVVSYYILTNGQSVYNKLISEVFMCNDYNIDINTQMNRICFCSLCHHSLSCTISINDTLHIKLYICSFSVVLVIWLRRCKFSLRVYCSLTSRAIFIPQLLKNCVSGFGLATPYLVTLVVWAKYVCVSVPTDLSP